MQIPRTSQTATLVIVRFPGPPEFHPSMTVSRHPRPKQVRVYEPPVQIILDGRKLGTINPLRVSSFFDTFMGPAPSEKRSQFEIRAGHHNLLVNLSGFYEFFTKFPYYDDIFSGNFVKNFTPATLSFDIASGEAITIGCQYTWVGGNLVEGHMIQLEKAPEGM